MDARCFSNYTEDIMKQLNSYIFEKFRINRDTEVSSYHYQPKTKSEIRSIIRERLEQNKNADLNDIDVSKITNMNSLFEHLDPHNIKIDRWNVSNVENMYNMFFECKNFNSDLSNWDVSNVKDTSYMFSKCSKFNCDLSKWDVSNVKYMYGMFYRCSNFDGIGLENWDVSNVIDMNYMFDECKLKKFPKWYHD